MNFLYTHQVIQTYPYTCVVNTYLKEYFVPGDLLPAGMGQHALAILLRDKDSLVEGRWAGDPICWVDATSHDTALHRVVEDPLMAEQSAFDLLQNGYLDLTPLLIVYCSDEARWGREPSALADAEPDVFFDTMNLDAALAAHPLCQAILERQPPNWRENCKKRFSQPVPPIRISEEPLVSVRTQGVKLPPVETAPAITREFLQSREPYPEEAHTFEIVKIDGTHVVADIQLCPLQWPDGSPIERGLTGISCQGEMHAPDALFVFRALLSAWRNMPSGLHFINQIAPPTEALRLRKPVANIPIFESSYKLLLRCPVLLNEALSSAGNLLQCSWVGEPYLSTSCGARQVSYENWQAFQKMQAKVKEYIPEVRAIFSENWWRLPKMAEVVRLEFTVQDPSLVSFLNVGMRWRVFRFATLCPHCGAVESGRLCGTHSDYKLTYENKYEERGVFFEISDYECRVCKRTWAETFTVNYRDTTYP